jgi:CBS domain-containing protein
MQVRDVMTRNVISVTQDETVVNAARLMLQNSVSGLPVVAADGKLVGIVTEGDLLRREEIGTERQRTKWLQFLLGPARMAEDYVRAAGRKIEDVMTREPVTVSEDDTLPTVVELMERRHIKRLPVVGDGRLIGIVSRANLMHALVRLAQIAEPPAGDDADIRDQVLKAFADQPWAPQVKVEVHNGVVELSGLIADERERQGCVVVAENVAGVKRVHDHLVWVEPMSGMSFPSPEDADEKQVPISPIMTIG